MRLTLETGTTRMARPLPACSPSGWGTPPGPAWCGRLRFRSGFACLGLAIGRSLFPGALLLDEPFAARGDRLGGQGLGVWYAILAPIRPRVQAMLLQMASGEPLQRCLTFQARDAVESNTGLPREHGGHRRATEWDTGLAATLARLERQQVGMSLLQEWHYRGW
jgi:hypothetical protein